MKTKTKTKKTIKPKTYRFNTTVEKEVCAAYCEETRNLNFKASAPVSVNDAVLIMTKALEIPNEKALGYNEFSPSLLRNLPGESKVILAREGSVCVYVIASDAKGLTEDFAYNKLNADEFHRQEDGSVRLWWD